ncbi:MAG: hypothetical protein MUE81_05320 [Thermoflexibacter sp.]|jgi:hypothetical protein|nr:hypothetical protein [Thermoflexibacter sp.]
MIKINAYSFFLILISIGLSACQLLGWCKDDSLSSPRIDYTGNQLKVNGYYYGDSSIVGGKTNVLVSYFYRNGIFIDRESVELTKVLSNIIPNEPLNQIKGIWGIFKIEGNKITIESFRSSMCGVKTSFIEGEILNDTTYLIKSSESRDKGRVTSRLERNSIYRFRQSNIKPDSTNNFIK